MKFTFSWLKDHLETSHSLTEICDALPMLGLEVESLSDPLQHLGDFLVAEITHAERHPDADRLQICTVNKGDGQSLQIVCGAPNARAGLKTVLAPVGAWIPGSDMILKEGKIRGQASQGMLCSYAELALGEDHDGIAELPADAKVGSSFAHFAAEAELAMTDPVIEIAITPNRGDCLGVRGVARDLAAAGYGTLKPLDFSAEEGSFSSSLVWEIDDAAKPFVPLISGRMFEGVKNGDAPQWMANRLTAVGQRPISALVDITNYVMIDLGRPLHAYDADKVAGDRLIVRLANKGEQVEALNEKTYSLEEGALVIGDIDGPDDLAGIMGGERTGVSETTTRMFLEIAVFDPVKVAITGRQLNLHSDARYRFERGLDACSPIEMAGYIARLVSTICGGTSSHLVVEGVANPAKKTIAFHPEKVLQLTGVKCPPDTQAEILSVLGFEVDKSQPEWQVAVPHWRNDMDGAADLVEEIIRIYGFDKLEMASLPRSDVVARPSFSAVQKRGVMLRRTLATRGLTEAVTFSFMKRQDAEYFDGNNDQLMLANPISHDLNMMRPSVIPNLLQAMGRNINRGIEEVCFFEIGPVFLNPDEDGQRIAVGGVRHGRRQLADWQQAEQRFDLFDAKADLLAGLSVLGVRTDNLVASRDVPAWLHPGRSGRLSLGKMDMGVFGEIHPAICRHFDIPEGVAVFEFWLDNIPVPRRKGPAKSPIDLSALQPVSRDFAFIVAEEVEAQALIDAVRRAARDLVDSVSIFDIYQGKGIDEGHKSVALNVRLQPRDSTFSEEEIAKIADQIIANVAKNCGGILRG